MATRGKKSEEFGDVCVGGGAISNVLLQMQIKSYEVQSLSVIKQQGNLISYILCSRFYRESRY